MYGMMSFAAAPSYSSLLRNDHKKLSLKKNVNSSINNFESSDNTSLKTTFTNTTSFDVESSASSLEEFVTKVKSETTNIHSNYSLVKMDTRDSQHVSLNQYRVNLSLTKSEIELVRYTWNRMLLDDEESSTSTRPDRSSSPKLPGSFPGEPDSDQLSTRDGQSTHSGTAKMIRAKSSAIATSLFCRQFYANLLSKDSELEKIFPSIKHQAVSFAAVLSLAVMQLEDLSRLEDYLSKLGKRHSRILNIEPMHFELMGEALIQTFHERFGMKFNQELEILWIKLYLYLANSILQFGIDPTMDYESYQYSGAPTRNNSMIDDLNSHDDEKSIMTQNTSVSVFTKQSEQKRTEPVVIPPIPSFATSTSPRPTTPRQLAKVLTQPRQAAPAPIQAPPSKKIIKTKRKRDCIIM